MTDCLFCKIVAGEIPSEKIYEDEHLVAIRDIHPLAPTHLLLVPRKHVATLNDVSDLGDGAVAALLRTASALAVKEGVSEEGYRVVINCNRGAGQEVFHLHVHVMGGRPLGRMG